VKRCIVFGFDGMDPGLAEKLMKAGRLPNFAKLAEQGNFSRLGTSTPPQSPVAWSNFISGGNPGTHGIFDFIARDAATLAPYLSTSRVAAGGRSVRVGGYRFPLSGGEMQNLRRGPTLWRELEARGVPCTVLRIPANFPPVPAKGRTLSGLGTPDLHGGYGIFTCYTDRIGERTRDVPGGHFERVRVREHVIETALPGPQNTFAAAGGHASVPLVIRRDPSDASVRVTLQGSDFILRQGEWSDWVPVRYELVPHLASVSGICRFYLKSARDDFTLYVSPVNIDPADPAMPVTTPAGFAPELAGRLGRFYTQGMAEDTSALSAGVLDDALFREQSLFVHQESVRMFHSEFPRFKEGLFFFYFSSLDQNSHAFWRTLDPTHPSYTPELAAAHGDYLPWLYEDLDRVLGEALAQAGPDTLVLALSDHGFGSFKRQFNLNAWLLDNGYAEAAPGVERGTSEFFGDVKWGGTQAYGLGINSLYLNVAGREPDGAVKPAEFRAVRDELARRLEAVVDPATGGRPIHRVFFPEQIYSGPETANAPDLIVGYHRGWRASWDTILGKYPREVFLDNLDPWSGDHCIDPEFCSGCLFSNRALGLEQPRLEDLAGVILRAFAGHCG
jgi:predicted AlkP superfamily phosphohydrolase/phosphomutase